MNTTTVDHDEIARFDELAKSWWDPDGPMRPLHQLNPVRLAYIRDSLCRHFDRAPLASKPFSGLRLLDIGCGAGLLSEPLRRLGADVVAIDAAGEVIDAARRHAEEVELDIDYRKVSAEELVEAGESFDAVFAMEILEHVSDVGAFVTAAGALTRPGGALLAATLNRTLKAFGYAIVGAEWIMGWLPRGTHQWDKFLRPSEVTGLSYDALSGTWESTSATDVNYMIFSTKPPV